MYGMESNFTYPVDHKSTNERMPLVNVHPQDGKEFIFYQYVYFDKLWKDGVELTPEQRDEVEQELQDLVVRSRFIDNFVFRKGDLLIMDQLYTMHRRSPIRDTNRLLWRTAFDYPHLQMQLGISPVRERPIYPRRFCVPLHSQIMLNTVV